jgi:hypothetical protein
MPLMPTSGLSFSLSTIGKSLPPMRTSGGAELVALLGLANAAQDYVSAVLESADRFTPEDLE